MSIMITKLTYGSCYIINVKDMCIDRNVGYRTSYEVWLSVNDKKFNKHLVDISVYYLIIHDR